MTGESALDKAVKRDRVDIFIALIRLGAGIRINVDAAQAFMEKYIKHPEMAKTSQILAAEKPRARLSSRNRGSCNFHNGG